MSIQRFSLRTLALAAGMALGTFSGAALADPPARIARLGYVAGAVSFSPAGENDWVQATVNRPLGNGDRLWAEPGARAELQVGAAMVRMTAGTSVSLLALDDRTAQLELTQGGLNVRVRRLEPGQVFEVDTPNLAFTLRQPGDYRIDVDPDGQATTIVMRSGEGVADGEGVAYVVDAQQPYRFTGTALADPQAVQVPPMDDFDRWASDRDRAIERSPSARYVSADVVGYQDLDDNGTWRVDATYGNVWMPRHVPAGWAPYRDGHWAWVDPWGWTWVDDAPWGFAVSHYGRWASFGGSWGWVPGPVRTRAYYAPALVVFVGGDNFRLSISTGNVGGVGWFPLAPREVYRPAYAASPGYVENINRSNTVINNTVIRNTYNTTNVTNIVYANRQVPGAVVAVPTETFTRSQPVARSAVRVTREMTAGGALAAAPPVAPTLASVHGAATAGGAPPAHVFERAVVARTAPPAPHAGFEAHQAALNAKPGKPLDEPARQALKPAAAAPAPVVKVLAAAQDAPRKLVPKPAGAAPAGERTQGPAAKAPEAGTPEAKAREGNAPETKAPPTKAPATPAPDAKGPDAKGPEAKAPDAKGPDAKAPDAKAPDAKAPDAKGAEPRAADAPNTPAAMPRAPATASPDANPPPATPRQASPRPAAAASAGAPRATPRPVPASRPAESPMPVQAPRPARTAPAPASQDAPDRAPAARPPAPTAVPQRAPAAAAPDVRGRVAASQPRRAPPRPEAAQAPVVRPQARPAQPDPADRAATSEELQRERDKRKPKE